MSAVEGQAAAWRELHALLHEVAPQLMAIPGSGLEKAKRAIRALAGADPDTEVTAEAHALLRSGDAKGREKYGVTLDDADLAPAQLVQHAAEEAADLLKYLVALRRTLKETPRGT